MKWAMALYVHISEFLSQHGRDAYYLQPAAYADVTDSWRLSKIKWQRVARSLAGVYVQSLVTTFAVGICLALRTAGYRADLLLIFVAINLFSIAFNLVPFVKLDGYWILSIIVGVPNLSRFARWSGGEFLLCR